MSKVIEFRKASFNMDIDEEVKQITYMDNEYVPGFEVITLYDDDEETRKAIHVALGFNPDYGM